MMAKSYVKGASTPPLLEQTIDQALAAAIARTPDLEMLVSRHQNVRWTYCEFGERAERLAAGLVALGLNPGDRVGIWAPNCAEWILTQFATANAGLILVNINPAYRLSEVEYTLNKVGVRALVCAERFKSSEYVAMMETLAPEIARAKPGHLVAKKLPAL